MERVSKGNSHQLPTAGKVTLPVYDCVKLVLDSQSVVVAKSVGCMP
jgi:hypothetical protein